MKKIILSLIILIPYFINAQNCKPDLDKTDKITKQENKGWETFLYESGLGNAMFNTSDWYLTVQFGRYGNQNLINLFLFKLEESLQNETFESQYRGERGREYYFAFTEGDPIKLIVHSTNTVTKMDNLLGKLRTTVTFTSILSDNNIVEFKSHFDKNNLTAIRVSLAGNINFEKDVKPKKAENAKEKFNCFYDFNEKNKIKLPEEADVNDLPPNPNVPEIMPRDPSTNKVTFTDIITIDGATKDQLYNRTKSWMVNYYKNEQFSINSKEDGRITREGMFPKTYNVGNGKTAIDKNYYSISVFVKDNKYKYEITDIMIDDSKQKISLESAYEQLANLPKHVKYANQQIYEGVDEIIKSLTNAMLSDSKAKNDW